MNIELDEIVSIKKIGKRKTIDIETDGNNLFLANDILTHNSSVGKSVLSLDDMADSFGPAMNVDVVISVTQPEDLRKTDPPKFSMYVNKNRDGINKQKFLVNVNYYRQQITDSDDETNDKIQVTNKSIPVTQKQQDKKVDSAVSDVINIIAKDDKKKKDIIFE